MGIDSLPCSENLENAVLGYCLKTGIAPPCHPEVFYVHYNRALAVVLHSMAEKQIPINIISVTDYVKDLRSIGGAVRLVDLEEIAANQQSLDYYISILVEKHKARQIIKHYASYIKKVNHEPDLRALTEDLITRILDTQAQPVPSLVSDSVFSQVESDIESRLCGNGVKGIKSGYRILDKTIGGLNAQDLIILAGRPSMGKTAYALNIARNVARSGKRVLLFSLEMSAFSVVQRLVAMEAKVPLKTIRFGIPSAEQTQKIQEAIQKVQELPLVIEDAIANVGSLHPHIQKHKPDLIILDYLQLLDPPISYGNTVRDVTETSKSTKRLARRYNVPLILLSQLSRANEKEKRKPLLSDLRDSGQIEQDADAVLFLHAKEHNESTRKAILAKARNGECTDCDLFFDKSTQLFYEVDP